MFKFVGKKIVKTVTDVTKEEIDETVNKNKNAILAGIGLLMVILLTSGQSEKECPHTTIINNYINKN